ncbi:hypothetical protein ACM614_20720 [Streptomyces sp. 12297]
MKSRSLGAFLSAGIAALFATTVPTPAQAAVGDCRGVFQHCVWGGQDFTGPMKDVTTERGCHNASEYGLAGIGSARIGYGRGMAGYPGANCTGQGIFIGSEGTVFNPPMTSFFHAGI